MIVFKVLPVFTFYKPDAYPIADNENLNNDETYVKNGTSFHFLNLQNNFVQKIEHLPKVYAQGPGTAKPGLWKKSDVFQLVMLKSFEE